MIAAILLAAGASSRMGRPKPLLPWGGRTLIEWEVEELLGSSVDDIVVVTGSRAEDVRRSLGAGGRYCVFNPRWPQGRSTSLATGARALNSPGRTPPEAVVIQNVDQPTRTDIIERLLEEWGRSHAPAVQPSYEGKGCHPVVVSGHLLHELEAVNELTLGLRGFLDHHKVYRLPMDDEPVIRLDMNTPVEFEGAKRLFGVEV